MKSDGEEKQGDGMKFAKLQLFSFKINYLGAPNMPGLCLVLPVVFGCSALEFGNSAESRMCVCKVTSTTQTRCYKGRYYYQTRH